MHGDNWSKVMRKDFENVSGALSETEKHKLWKGLSEKHLTKNQEAKLPKEYISDNNKYTPERG